MIPLRLYSLVVSGFIMGAVAYYLFRGKRKSTDDIERERRDMLGQIGRITDGTVIDVQENSEDPPRPATMLIYHYDVAGVSYEASQDVTYLRQWINLQSCRLGVPTSVRYDPHNPGNSMVVSEKWNGLRGSSPAIGLSGTLATTYLRSCGESAGMRVGHAKVFVRIDWS